MTRGMADPADTPIAFVPKTVLKRDAFSETVSGHAANDPERKLVLRKLDGLPIWSRWFAWILARREIRGLRGVAGIDGVPMLLRVDREGLLRDWSEGAPLNISPPKDVAWYRDAHRLLREMRRRGVTHNDLAKPQNWLMRPDGRAAVIDFQLSRVHRRRGLHFRLAAYEDLRHLLKQKRRYAPELLTAKQLQIVRQRSWPGQLWQRTGKRAYKFITRKLFNWSDGEGTEHLAARDGPAIRDTLLAHPRVRALALSPVPMPGRGAGLYGFAETDLSAEDLRALIPIAQLPYLQPVAALPRRDGALCQDLLDLIAMNRHDELEQLLKQDPQMRPVVEPILAGRLNLSDRRFYGTRTVAST